ncbi:MAG TPA: FmdE family protein [Dissulfurispiraceae bacterium]|nr:FmdE family protein [Dissulfurispiraceae bacterium]
MKAILQMFVLFLALVSFCLTLPGVPHALPSESSADWYFPAWLDSGLYSPAFQVRDTENKYGRYTKQTKTTTLKDLIKFHGHFCGGLVESAGSLRLAFDRLFPDGIADRTDLRIVSNNSACGADVASYLTGARARFGSHAIDNKLTESEFYVQLVSTGRTIHVKLNPEVYPKEVKTQMRKIESGKYEPKDIDLFQELQWAYAKRTVSKPLAESYIAREVHDFTWPGSSCRDLGVRKDNDYKNVPPR